MAAAARVLQREPGRTVTLEDGGATVRKTFHGDDAALLTRMAAREFDRRSRFRVALRDVDLATCPRPLEVGAVTEPFVRMERAVGVPMQDHLARTSWTAQDYQRVADVMRIALIRYVQTFDEPYWDFIVRNIFFDPDTGTITFFDFGIPVLYEPAIPDLERLAPLEVSLGSLLASSVFEAGRPRRFWRRREHRQAQALAAEVLARCLDASEGLPVSIEGVARAARLTFDLAATDGGWLRRTWYRSCGRLLTRPSATLRRLGADHGTTERRGRRRPHLSSP